MKKIVIGSVLLALAITLPFMFSWKQKSEQVKVVKCDSEYFKENKVWFDEAMALCTPEIEKLKAMSAIEEDKIVEAKKKIDEAKLEQKRLTEEANKFRWAIEVAAQRYTSELERLGFQKPK